MRVDLEEKIRPLPEPLRPRSREPEVERAEGPLQIGDTVRVLSFGQNAELLGLSADRSEAEVQMGALRFRVNVDNIERLSKRKAAVTEPQQAKISVPRYEDRPEVATQLDMRGWRVEQALEELETYLNDAAMSGMSSIRIVHGKGTGALRQAVTRAPCASCPGQIICICASARRWRWRDDCEIERIIVLSMRNGSIGIVNTGFKLRPTDNAYRSFFMFSGLAASFL